MRRARKFQALLLAISVMVGIVASAVPANAAPLGTANLTTSRSVRAGAADQLFTFNVANTGSTSILSPGTGINHIVVIPPGGFSTDLGTTGLAGWTSKKLSNGQIVFDAPATGGALAPGANANFVVQADAATPPFDLSRAWKVMASDDRGQTLKQFNAPATGSLTTAIRTLEVLSVTVVGDPRITDMSVTEQQGGIQVQTRIANMANAAQTVTGTLTGRAITVEQADGAKSIGAGLIETYNFVIKVGNKADYTCTNCGGGKVTLTGDGTSSQGSDAMEAASGAITVMSRVVGAFQTGTLAPREVAANKPYEFALSIEKDGDAALANLTGTTFSFANNAFSTSVASPSNIVAGDNQSTRLTFASKSLGALADGNYTDAKLAFMGTDENGAAVNQVINITDTINVDSLIPSVVATLTPPASETSAPPAASNGQTQQLRAVVTDGSGNAPCTTCTITEAFLQQYQGGTKLAAIPVTLTPAGSPGPLQPAPAGTWTGSYSGNYDAAATSVELFVRAADRAGNDSTDVSDLFAVDNIAPFLSAATTGANGAKNQILVTLSEEVTSDTGSTSANDWNVPGHTVSAAALQAGNTSVLLTVSPNVGDNATPSVQYAPAGLEISRFYDRVALDAANQAITAVDGIVPVAPLLAGVTGGESDGTRFHTNDSTPELVYGDSNNPVGAGHRLEVYEDLNNNGQLDAGEPKIGEATAEGNTVAVTVSSLGTTERDVAIVARALDANNNSSEVSDSVLKLDFTEPRILTVARALDDVTLTFTEGLSTTRGRNFATDWTLHDRSIADPNFWVQFKADTIDGTGTIRTLHMDATDTSWDTATLTHVEYEFIGPAGQRHADLAGNELIDGLRAV